MSGGPGFDTWWKRIENTHHIMEAECILLGYFHWFELSEFGTFGHTIFSIVGQVAHIGDIANISDLVAEMPEVAVDNVEAHIGTAITEVGVVINSGAAHIHTDVSGRYWLKYIFFPRECVVYSEFS
jgi:hypothetical protein